MSSPQSAAAAVDEKRRMDAAFPDAPTNFSHTINSATKDLHNTVNVLIVQRLQLGLRDYRLYREGIQSFYYPYAAFEKAWASLLSNPSTVQPHVYAALQALADPRLERAPAIAADLAYLYGSFDAAAPPNTKERLAFVEHIEKTLREKPHVLLAYAHSYYMALFAGGKMLCRQILATKDFFPVRAPAGNYDEAKVYATNMFVFPMDKGKDEELRTRFKDSFQAVEGNLTEEEKTDIIAESRFIFKMNERLVRELDEICDTLAIPTPQLDVSVEAESLLEKYKLPLMLLLGTFLWSIKLYFKL